MKNTKWIALILSLVMILSLCACGAQEDTQTAEAPAEDAVGEVEPAGEEAPVEVRTTDKTELVIGSDYEPTDMNYYDGATDSQGTILMLVYDTLFTWDGEELVGSLVESYEYGGDDGLDLILHLREGITFTNGDPLTADDVLFTMEQNLAGLATASRFACIDMENSYAENDTTVVFRLKQFDNTLLPYLATEYGRVLDSRYYEEVGRDTALGTDPVGTGPYVIGSWEHGTSLTLVKNENYWGDSADQPFESIKFMFYSEDSIRSLEFEQGNLDIALLETAESVERLSGREDEGIHVLSTPLTKEGYFCMATIIEDDTFQDVNKRLAVAYALDMEAIVSTIAGATAITATSLIPSGCPGYEDMSYEYNPELAKEYLEKAGCPDGFTFKMEVANNQQLNLELAEAMQAYLSMVGITMEIEPLDFFTQFGNMLAGTQLCSIMVGTANGDASMGLTAFEVGSGACIAENHDEEFIRLVEAVRYEEDQDVRMELMAELQQYMHDTAYCIPVYERVYSLAYQDYVAGAENALMKGENMFFANRLSFAE